MNKTSVVIDGHTVSHWKYQLIDKLYKENNLKNIYLTNHNNFTLTFSVNRVLIKNLFKITISELFEEIDRIPIIENSQYSGDLIWLSETPIDFMYNESIYYFSNESSDQKFEKSYYAKNLKEHKFITYLTLRTKNVNKIVNVSWTEEAKFSEGKTISKHLESLKFLVANRSTEINTNYKKLMNNSDSVRNSGLISLIKKIYYLVFNYPSWSIYTYPKILDIFGQNSLDESMVKKVFNDRTWSFKADPFYSENDNSLYFEKFNYFLGTGKLAKYNFENKSIKDMKTSNNIHYSYPCIFEYEGKTYLIPEGAQNNKIEIYRVDQESLVKVNTVISDFAGVDPTIVEHNNIWYVFATDGRMGGHSYLNIFYAKNPLDEWMQHNLNPVKINLSNARGGGSIFREGDSLIRPAQNCFPDYGTSLVFNKIKYLTPNEFEETVIGELRPHKNSIFKGIHTISKNKESLIVDLKTNEYFPFARFITLLRARVKSDDAGLLLENSLFKRITVIFLFLVFVILIYLFGWRALSLFV